MSNATALPAGTRVSAPMGWNAQGAENPRALGTLHTDMEAGDRWAHVRWDEADLPAFVPAYSLAAIR